jgi:hypothetical protein
MMVSEGRNNEIEARFAKLERENMMLKRWGAVAILLAGALLLVAQAPARPRTPEAERLVIRYPDGKEGIVLEAPSATGAGAYFTYPNGRQGIALEASPSTGFGAGAYFHPTDGKGGAWITAFAKETGFHVASPKDNLRIEMSATEDEAGFGAMSMPLTPLFNMSVTSKGDAVEALYNKDGKVLWRAP